MFTTKFWKQAAERAVKSAAQALLLLWAADAGFNVISADLGVAGGTAAGAAVLSLLTSVVTSGMGEKDSPSAVTP
jgi:hypothetical protein